MSKLAFRGRLGQAAVASASQRSAARASCATRVRSGSGRLGMLKVLISFGISM